MCIWGLYCSPCIQHLHTNVLCTHNHLQHCPVKQNYNFGVLVLSFVNVYLVPERVTSRIIRRVTKDPHGIWEVPLSYLVFINGPALKYLEFLAPKGTLTYSLQKQEQQLNECCSAVWVVNDTKLDDFALRWVRSSGVSGWEQGVESWALLPGTRFCKKNICLSYASTQRAALLTSFLSVRTMEWVFLMILIATEKIKLVSNTSESVWCPRTRRSCARYHNACFEKQIEASHPGCIPFLAQTLKAEYSTATWQSSASVRGSDGWPLSWMWLPKDCQINCPAQTYLTRSPCVGLCRSHQSIWSLALWLS